jgi:hypothetical protein
MPGEKTIFRPLPETTDQRAVHKKGILTTLRHSIPPPSLSNSRYPSAPRSILLDTPALQQVTDNIPIVQTHSLSLRSQAKPQ